jgi:hypothetical protein
VDDNPWGGGGSTFSHCSGHLHRDYHHEAGVKSELQREVQGGMMLQVWWVGESALRLALHN